MRLQRRSALAALVAFAAASAGPMAAREKTAMFGLIGEMKAKPGQREALISILLEGINEMPGCLSYVVARDPASQTSIWITEVWDSKASHERSLKLPAVRDAINRAMPLIEGFGQSITTEPVGGASLPA